MNEWEDIFQGRASYDDVPRAPRSAPKEQPTAGQSAKECSPEGREKRPSLLAGLAGLWRLRR
jgi:hypothetical protein